MRQHARNVVCMQNDLKPVKYCGTARSCMLNVPSNAVADRNKSAESDGGGMVGRRGGGTGRRKKNKNKIVTITRSGAAVATYARADNIRSWNVCVSERKKKK